MMKHVFRAIGRPDGEQMVIAIPEASAPTHGDEPRIADLREDHRSAFRSFSPPGSTDRTHSQAGSSDALTDDFRLG